MATSSVFGHTLLRLRLAAGFTQTELANRSGVSVRGISDLERGARLAPRLETVRLLADALDLDRTARAELLTAARFTPEAPLTRSPRAPARRAANLPVPMTSLIGRDAEIAQIHRLLLQRHIRLVTLTGPGGVGKTRLAIAVAHAAAQDFVDGSAFVDLAPIRDWTVVASTVATALDVAVPRDETVISALRDAGQDRQLLLILDNLEQVLGAAPFIVDLLRACPGITILVTSRARLQVSGEQTVLVAPLSLPQEASPRSTPLTEQSDAVRLFQERAAAVKPGFTVTERNAAAISAICRRLDGLPLAIELAAARINLMSPEEVLARLGPGLPILRGGPVDQPDRLRTMYDAIVWSLDLLSEDERRLFAALAVFHGGFSLAAVETVGGESAIETLATLVNQSLVMAGTGPEGETRFSLLETIREVARQELDASGDATAAQDRHAAFFGELAERADSDLWGSQQSSWLNRLDAEHDNLRAALSWLTASGVVEPLLRLAGALSPFWLLRGHAREGRAVLERALVEAAEAAAEPLRIAPATLARAQFRLAALLTEIGDFAAATDLLHQAQVIRQALGDQEGVGHVLSWRGAVAEFQGDDESARQWYADALAVFRETGDHSLISNALANLADTACRQGDLAEASRLAHDAVAAARRADNAIDLAIAVAVQAAIALTEGRVADAAATLDESLRLSLSAGYRSGTANALGLIAGAARAVDCAPVAVSLLAAAQTVREDAGLHRVLNQRLIDQTHNALETALDPFDFAAAWDEGQSLSLAQAIDLARTTVSQSIAAQTGRDRETAKPVIPTRTG